MNENASGSSLALVKNNIGSSYIQQKIMRHTRECGKIVANYLSDFGRRKVTTLRVHAKTIYKDCEDGEGDKHENVEVEDESVEKQRNDPPDDIVV